MDAWDGYGAGMPIEVVAHMHRISIKQIEQDMYGNPLDIDKRFGTSGSTELQSVLHICFKELKKGFDPALVAVGNNVPFCLINQLDDVGDIKWIADKFILDMGNKLIPIRQKQQEEFLKSIDHMVSIYSLLI